MAVMATRVRSTDEMLAAVEAGHEMAGMPLTEDDRAAAARVLRGETTADEEVAAMLAQFRASRQG